jgi:glycosyltransferase involved in cell wall biosynthesis
MILGAFSLVNKKIKFIGNWDNSSFGIAMKQKYSKFSNIELIDPIYDVETLSYIRSSCSYYIHGHSAGGTNPSLVEMMHFSKPILCFDCDYNRATTENSALFFCDSSELTSILSSSIEPNIGSKLKKIAKQRYTWDRVRKQYYDIM